MKLFVLIITSLVVLCTPTFSYACLCGGFVSVADLANSKPTVLLTSPVGDHSQNQPKRFKVWKTYLGTADEYEIIDMSESTSCAASYPLYETSIIIAYRDNKSLTTTYCLMKAFDRQQLIDYFDNGQDSLSRHGCFGKIKGAYDNEVFTGDFALENTECLVHKGEYDRKYRIKISSD